MKAIQYTVRGIPDRVDAELRRRARREGRSLNAVLKEVLATACGQGARELEYNDLDDLVGTWVADPEFDRVILEMDHVDAELWQ
jgi:hypothetical protein